VIFFYSHHILYIAAVLMNVSANQLTVEKNKFFLLCNDIILREKTHYYESVQQLKPGKIYNL